MPRPLRNDYPDAWHHVMNCGAGRRAVFLDDAERERFFGCVMTASRAYNIEVHAYCLLGNHYHLLVHSNEGKLSDAMRWVSSRYTQSLNYDKGRDGPMFRGRFASVSVDGDEQLMEASRYIHLNPVAAGLVTAAEAWPWSSAAAYLGLATPPQWLKMNRILEMFGPEPQTACREFLADGTDVHAMRKYEKFMSRHGVRPAGSDPGPNE